MHNKTALLLLLFLLPSIVMAETLEAYNIDLQVKDINSRYYILSAIEYNFNSSSNKNLTVVLPPDAWGVSLAIDDITLIPDVSNNKTTIPIKTSTKKVKLSFYTREMLNYNSPMAVFFTEFIAPFDSKLFKAALTLPPHSILMDPVEEANAKPTRIESNGQSSMLVWENFNASKNSKMTGMAVFNIGERSGIFSDKKMNIVLSVLVAIIMAQITFLIVYKKTRMKKLERKLSKKFSIDEHLKEDESQIINILRMKEGRTTQGTLRVITGMPKASLSKLLSELEARKVVHKEKSGKKNIVSLREHFMNNNEKGAEV
ncbi:hypothetical protein HYU07_02845 [Candidatus Woesearchaeota archaeon]|nr:hypothetical protein [Candidatus Woesearchaeota archaeon]